MKKVCCFAVCLFMLVVCVTGCTAKEPNGLWVNATYTADTVLGEGAKTVVVKVEAEDTAVTFTVKTDAEMLGDALLTHELIAGEESEYGLYIKTVNGITADYDPDGAYWAFYQNGEYAMTGIDSTPVTEGETYALVYTKG